MGWAVAPDARVYTFTLRSGVRFSTGAAFTAEAAAANLNRWLSATPVGPYPFVPAMFGGFAGELDETGQPMSNVASLSAVSAAELVIGLRQGDAALPATLAMPAFAMVDPGAFAQDGFGGPGAPSAGTGPYLLSAWEANTIRLARRSDYWGPPAVAGELAFIALPDDAARVVALERSEVDGLAGLPLDQADLGLRLPVRVVQEPAHDVLYLGFNQSRRPWGTLECRQAVARILDRTRLAAVVAPDASAATSLRPGTTLGPALDALPGPDPSGASTLWAACLAQQPLPPPATYSLYVPPLPRRYLPDPAPVATRIGADLAALGIAVTVVSPAWPDVWQNEVQSGRADLFLLGWGGVNGDPDAALCPLLCGANPALRTDQLGFAVAPDDELAAILVQARATAEPTQRAALYAQADRLIGERVPVLPLTQRGDTWVFREGLRGEQLGPMESLFLGLSE
jgi:peptide/nickel transport system substrate-binding protein